MQLSSIPDWALAGYGVAVASVALWKGGRPERAVGATVLVEFLTQGHVLPHVHAPHWLEQAWDIVILATCVICALRSNRYWTIWASSFALLSVVTPALRFMPGVGWWAYLSAERVWAILLVAALLAGAWSASRPPAR